MAAPWWILDAGHDFLKTLVARVGRRFALRGRAGSSCTPVPSSVRWLSCPFLCYDNSFSCFFKKVLPALGRKHIFEDRPTTFCIKKATFGSPKRKDKPCLGHFVRSYRSFARPIRILCASVAHQKSCSRLGPVHFSHPRADQRTLEKTSRTLE